MRNGSNTKVKQILALARLESLENMCSLKIFVLMTSMGKRFNTLSCLYYT